MERTRRLAVVLLLLVASTGAADELGLADVDRDVAREDYQRGRARYESGDYAGALTAFEDARRLHPAPELDFNIGRCHDRLRHWAEAADAYQRYLDARPSDPQAAEVRARVGALRARVAPAPVEVRAAPPPRPRASVAPPAALLGGAVAAGVVGAGLLGSVAHALNDVPDHSLSPTRVDGLRREAYAGYAMLGVGGALLVVDVALWARWAVARRAR